MKRILIALASISILGIPAISSATPPRPGGYLAGFLGVNFPRDTDVSTYDYAFDERYDDDVEFDPGIAVGGAVGYDYGFLRLEGEISYRHAEIDTVTDVPSGVAYNGVDGDFGALAFMANAFFDLHNNSPITPYWGGGVGFAVLSASDVTSAEGLLYEEGEDTVFAYQAGAGVEIALNPFISLDLGYRYFGTAKGTIDDDSDLSTKFKLESHNALMGVRVKF